MKNHLTPVRCNSSGHAAFITEYGLLEILKFKKSNFTEWTHCPSNKTYCFKPEPKFFAASTCQWITQCEQSTFGMQFVSKLELHIFTPTQGRYLALLWYHTPIQALTASSVLHHSFLSDLLSSSFCSLEFVCRVLSYLIISFVIIVVRNFIWNTGFNSVFNLVSFAKFFLQ